MKACSCKLSNHAFILPPSAFRLACVLVSLIFLSSCSPTASPGSPPGSDEINVAAAANLTDAFAEMGRQFTAQTGVRVVYSFGATADLAKQIENGAPFDLFAAADVEHVDGLMRKGLLTPGTQALYARGRLVLWTPQGSRPMLNRIEDIRRADVERIAIAKPDLAPYGRAAVEALKALNLWTEIEPKVIYAQNVSQARQYAATGNAEAAFIPRSLVKDDEGHAIEIDERLHQPIDQALAVVRSSEQQDTAKRFVSYVLSPEGQALLERYGYKRSQ